ncbi:MAG: hypothetical protein LBI36_00190 [Oscillospiraceae bacterium]|jgi:hypothetical protein|nr:hypothetical protein [Oscillospiraceae bacterium]
MKAEIKKVFDGIKPRRSNNRFADMVIQRARERSVSTRSPVAAACVAAALVIGAGAYFANAALNNPGGGNPELNSPGTIQAGGGNDTGISRETGEAWEAFYGLAENAEALKSTAFIPECDIAENTFDGLEITVSAMASDGEFTLAAIELRADPEFESTANEAPFPFVPGDDKVYQMGVGMYPRDVDVNVLYDTGYPIFSAVETFVFDENGKARTLVTLYCPDQNLEDGFRLGFSGLGFYSNSQAGTFNGQALFDINLRLPPCPTSEILLKGPGVTAVATPFGLRFEDGDGELVSSHMGSGTLKLTFGDGSDLITLPNFSSAMGTFLRWYGDFSRAAFSYAGGKFVILDVENLQGGEITDSYPPKEGGIPVADPNLSELEKQLLETVDRLQWRCYMAGDAKKGLVKVGWSMLSWYLTDKYLTAEEMIAEGLMTEEELYLYYPDYPDGFWPDTVRISDMREIYDSLFAPSSNNIVFDPAAGIGFIVQDKYFRVAAHGYEYTPVTVLVGVEAGGSRITLTVAEAQYYSYYEYITDFYGETIGYWSKSKDGDAVEFYVYPYMIDSLDKIDYTFVATDDGYKISSIKPHGARD